MQGVGLVDIFGARAGILDRRAQGGAQGGPHAGVGRRGEVLQGAKVFDLQPGRGDAVIGVVGGHVPGAQAGEQGDQAGGEALVARGRAGDQAKNQGDHAQEQPHIPLVVQDGGQAGRPLVRGQGVLLRRGFAHQAQQGEGGLLADGRAGCPIDEDGPHVRRQQGGHLRAAHVGDEGQGQALEGLIAGDQVGPHGIEDEAEEVVALGQQQRARQVADLLLRVPGRRDQVGGLAVPEFDVMAQHVDVQQLPHILFLVVVWWRKMGGGMREERAGGGEGGGAPPRSPSLFLPPLPHR